MKTLTIPGKHYIVRSSTGCTVTQETSPGKYITASVPADEDTPVFAHTGKFDIDDEGAIVTEVFNSAPYQKLRLLGVVGGNDGLPISYTRLEYLGVTGTQILDTLIVPQDDHVLSFDFTVGHYNNYNELSFYDTTIKFNDTGSMPFSLLFVREKARLRWGKATDKWVRELTPDTDFEMTVQRGRLAVKDVATGKTVSISFEVLDLTDTDTTLKLCKVRDIGDSSYLLNYKGIQIAKSENNIILQYVPALDPTGAPCMFDLVTKTPFYNSGTGAFIGGIETQKQLNAMLRKLPDRTGLEVGTLQVRLADELQTPENEAKLDAMQAKNWEITQAA